MEHTISFGTCSVAENMNDKYIASTAQRSVLAIRIIPRQKEDLFNFMCELKILAKMTLNCEALRR